MITCVVHYTIDPDQIAAFEQFARAWMRHVDEHGGTHSDFIAADRIRDESECVLRYERTFMRPLLPQGH
ncbi:hypothetical protein [Corynebacterium sp.]|uniref:hypothetical protein n=1 Tax=Corynebacterium sp. TaxID=1720 RepID=UPI002913E27A|nr:hypothetical protein [Corynebacterium sp.]MDU6014219.1 hypothetical protein [Corynebacterium sp.]